MKQFLLISIIFIFSSAGCSNTSVSKSTNKSEVAMSSNSDDFIAFNGNVYIKKSGWKVPSPKEKISGYSSVNSMLAEDGNDVKVSSTSYEPKGIWTYTEELSDSNEKLDFLDGELELQHFTEHSVNDKIFLYSIYYTRKTVSENQLNNNSHHERILLYLVQDNDGDGIFETLIADDAKVLVPKWLLR